MHSHASRPSFRFGSLFALGALFVAACGSDAGTGSSGAGGAGAVSGGAGAGGGSGAASAGATSAGAGAGAAGAAGGFAGGGVGGASAGSGGASGGAGTAGVAGSGGLSGSAGAGGNAGSGGAAPYNPCPTNGDACKIMPLGDSITDGCCGDNAQSMGASYRLELFHLSLMNNKKLTFVGSHESGPGMVDNVAFPKKQEGHPGWTIADGGGRDGLQDMVAGWLAATPAHIITLMIGTNDVDISLDLPNAPKRLGTLIDTIAMAAPKALIVVAQIVPSRKDDENKRDETYNAAIPALVKARADAGKHVILVDMYGAYTKHADFKTSMLANDLHPTDAGYATMATVWWGVIGNLLPAK